MAANTNTQDQGTQGQVQDQSSAVGDTTPAKLYATKAECEAAKPADAPKSLRPFEVFKNGTAVGWMLGRGYDPCLAALARRDGYSVSLGGKSQPVTKETVAAKLGEFTDDELLALGLTRKPQRGGKRLGGTN